MTHARLFFFSLILAGIAAAQGPFTAAQAGRGARVYAASCASCHGSELTNGGAPALAGAGFLAKMGGRPIAALLGAVRQMPPGAGGSLPAASYTDVTAFLLERNGHAAGTVELAADLEAARRTMIGAGAGGARAARPAEVVAVDPAARPAAGAGPTQQELSGAYASKSNWLYHTHDYSGSRYAASTQITPANAGRLRVACAFQLGEQNNFQSGPLVYNGRLYVTGIRTTAAIDARSCALIWKHEWTPKGREGWLQNRGVAIKDGYLIRGTTDGYLVALNLESGKMVWARRAANSDIGETFTMPPLIFEDRIVIGPAPSEAGISGWVGAFRLRDGEPLWRFQTVPRAGEPGAETWKNPRDIKLGGGAVWTPMTMDAEKGEVYVAVTNPAPDFPAHLRPGSNLYTNSVVALDARTGALRWHKQIIANDSHDWDLTQVGPLFAASAGGRDVKAMATAGKDGMLRAVDRENHTTLYETPVTTVENQSEPVTNKGVHTCPGIMGGVEWNGPAYSPVTKMLYTPAVDWCGTFAASRDEDVKFTGAGAYLGGTYRADGKKRGWITATDAVTGAVRWRYESAEPVVGAVTVTAGGVVFGGELTGHFVALDAKTGKVLLRFQTGGPIGGGVISYEVGGRQYVAVASGRPSSFWWGSHAGSPTVIVFGLE